MEIEEACEISKAASANTTNPGSRTVSSQSYPPKKPGDLHDHIAEKVKLAIDPNAVSEILP